MRAGILSARDRLLLAAAAPQASSPEAVAALLDAEAIDWSDALDAAAANRVGSAVTSWLEAEPLASRVDPGVRARWRALWMLQVFRAETAARQLRELGRALAGAGIEALVYKGLDFQERAHPPTHPRGFGDLDVIVRRAESARAAAALEGAGYAPPFGAPRLAALRRFHLHATYLHSRWRLPVELHWALDHPFAAGADPIPKVFAAAERSDAFGADLLRPCAVDALALMAVHLEKHLGLCATLPDRETRLRAVLDEQGLVWLLDVTGWLRAWSDKFDGESVQRRVRELGAARALVIALRLAADLDPTALPPWAASLAARLPHGRPLLSRIVYPDLGAGRAVSARGARRRAFLFRPHPRWVFRPLRVLEALLPAFRVPGS